MRRVLKICLSAWILGSLSGGLTGCQTLEPMKRADEGAALGRPANWASVDENPASHPDGRPGEVEGAPIFELAHQSSDVQVRFQRVKTPMIAQAHAPWTLLWLDELFDDVEIIQVKNAPLAGVDALRVDAAYRARDESIRDELWLLNQNGATYLLEFWGTPDAMEQTSDERRKIRESLTLSTPNSEEQSTDDDSSGEARNIFKSHETPYWRIELPQANAGSNDEASDIEGVWRMDLLDENAWKFHLPARLITVEILAEELDYPLETTIYAQKSLKRQQNTENLRILSDSTSFAGEMAAGILNSAGLAPMAVQYYYLTDEKRALQLVVSTPETLLDVNQPLIDQLVQSLQIQPADQNH